MRPETRSVLLLAILLAPLNLFARQAKTPWPVRCWVRL